VGHLVIHCPKYWGGVFSYSFYTCCLGVQKDQIANQLWVETSLQSKFKKKGNLIIGVVEQNTYIGKFDWA